MPAGIPSASAITRLQKASSSVTGSRSTIVSATGRPLLLDSPMSPRTTWLSHVTYWTGTGLSSPYFSRTASSAAGSRFSPASASAVSPGSARRPTKTTMLDSSRTIEGGPGPAQDERAHRLAPQPPARPASLKRISPSPNTFSPATCLLAPVMNFSWNR